MRMYYWHGQGIKNFGDELNLWMWPKLLPDIFDEDEARIFLGIGSVIFDTFPKDSIKLVLGSGYAGYSPKPVIDHTWKIYFVRGLLTAQALSLDPSLAIGDAAILLRSCILPITEKKFKVSFMPHWESAIWGGWAAVCERADVHYIHPGEAVEKVLEDLLASEIVITEAMHGAIVSDALRVPWISIEPIRKIHRMKWHDWASALGLNLESHSLNASNAFEWAVSRVDRSWARRLERYGAWLKGASEPFAAQAVQNLKRLSNARPSLSTDHAICFAHERMLEKVQAFQREHSW